MTLKPIPIVEVFGPTLQGEGALAGKPTHFIRTGGCDYSCWWCDTDIAVLPEMVRQVAKIDQQELIRDLTKHLDENLGPEWVTISGGNPALHDLGDTVEYLQGVEDMLVAVETQGSLWKPWLATVDLLTISPKGPSSGLEPQKSFDNLAKFMKNVRSAEKAQGTKAVLKVVVFNEDDYLYASAVHRNYPTYDFFLSVGTAMGGLRGDFVPPEYPTETFDKFRQVRRFVDEHGGLTAKSGFVHTQWTQRGLTDDVGSLLARWKWLADRMKGDPVMADVALFPQTHALIWGIHTRGV